MRRLSQHTEPAAGRGERMGGCGWGGVPRVARVLPRAPELCAGRQPEASEKFDG